MTTGAQKIFQAKMFAARLVNGTSDMHRNRHVIDAIFPQFLTWVDLEKRLNQSMFLVEVISCTNKIPDFREVFSYCVTAQWTPAAGIKVAKLVDLEFHITAGPSQFFSDSGYMMQISPWDGEIYGNKTFEIL